MAVSIEPPITVKRHERADREIEAAADQDEDLARREDGERRGAAQEIHHARRLEIGRLQKADHEIEDEKDDDRDIDPARKRCAAGHGVLERERHAASSRERNV